MAVELRKPSGAFIEIAKVWHEDKEINRLTGFPKGEAGVLQAQAVLDGMHPSPPPSARMFAIWEDDTPVGYIVFTDIDPDNRTADVHITLPRVSQGRGIGPEALALAVDQAFNEGLFRLTFKPMATNQRAVEAAAKVSFKVEARTKFSVWIDDGPKDQVQMRIVKPEWERAQR